MAAPTITDSAIAAGSGTGPFTTGSLTIASGDLLYVFIQFSAGTPGTVASVTSSGGGGALSEIADSGAVESYLRCHVWRSTSPTAGTVTVSVTPTVSTNEVVVIAVSVAGVDSGTPNGSVVFANGNGATTATSGTVSGGTDAIVLDCIGRLQSGAGSPGAGQTQLESGDVGGYYFAQSSWEAGAASVTTTWTHDPSTVSNWQWVIGALSINGSSGGGGASSPMIVLPPLQPPPRSRL